MWKKRVLWTLEQISFLPAGVLALDSGVSTCYYRENFNHCNCVAIDVDKGQEITKGTIDNIGNASAIPTDDKSFEAFLFPEVLENVYNPIGIPREMSRVLRPDGISILTVLLGSGLHQIPNHYFGGFTRYFYK